MRRALLPGGLAATLLALTTSMGTDYPANAGPAIEALAHGDVHQFVAAEVQMGPLSILLRAPLAALAGPESIWAYRLGALVCLLALVWLGGLVARRTGAAAGLLVATLLVANPVAVDALHLGHPEELLGASLCVAAVLLARDRPPLWSGLALGAALATKQWALMAIAPVLIAAPRGARVRIAATAAGTAAAMIAPLALADPHAFISALDHPAFGVSAMRTGNLWGFAAISEHVSLGGGETTIVYVTPDWLQRVAHPLVAMLTLGLGASALRRRAVDPLALLALLMLIRCALDPWDHAYYHAPFLAALIAWEVLEARRGPWLGAIAAAWLGIVFQLDLPLSDVLYALWALPMIGWLSRRAMRLEPLRAAPVPLPAA